MSQLRYDDSNWRDLLSPPKTEDGSPQWYRRKTTYASPEAEALGLTPFAKYPDAVIEWEKVPETIERCHSEKVFSIYHLRKYWDPADWYQDGLGYCWAYGLTAAVLLARALEGQPPVRLAPTSLGWLVRWKNQGFYCDAAIAGARERGIAPVEWTPEHVLSPGRFREGWEQEAKKYRPIEWWDLQIGRDSKWIIRQALTILATGRPLYLAYDWWGHALCCCGLRWEKEVIWQLWNSHGDGVIELSGARSIPDEAYGVRATSWGEGPLEPGDMAMVMT